MNDLQYTITSGWSGDHVYSLDDVNKLYRGCKRNTTLPFDFLLYAGPEAQKPGKLDGLDSGIRVVPSEYPSWWVGVKASDPDTRAIYTDTFLGLGLDCVVVGSLDALLTYPSERAAMKDYPAHRCPPGHENDMNGEVLLFRGDSYLPMWDAYTRAGKPTWDMTTPPKDRVWPMGHQGWINQTKSIHFDLFPENWVASYKLSIRKRGLPDDCRIVSFHGRPKPGEVDEPWIKEHWR